MQFRKTILFSFLFLSFCSCILFKNVDYDIDKKNDCYLFYDEYSFLSKTSALINESFPDWHENQSKLKNHINTYKNNVKTVQVDIDYLETSNASFLVYVKTNTTFFANDGKYILIVEKNEPYSVLLFIETLKKEETKDLNNYRNF